MKFKETMQRKNRKWEGVLELFDVVDVLGQIIWGLIRGVFHLIANILKHISH